MITDEHQEYEDGWRKNTLRDFKRGLNSTTNNTVTIVWDIVSFHLSSEWVISVFEEITKRFDYKPVEWAEKNGTTYITFKAIKPSQGGMELLQKACYDRI